jgi:hypothetical protein
MVCAGLAWNVAKIQSNYDSQVAVYLWATARVGAVQVGRDEFSL